MEPPFNKPLYNKVLGSMNDIRRLSDSTLQYMEMNPETTKPCYSEHILSSIGLSLYRGSTVYFEKRRRRVTQCFSHVGLTPKVTTLKLFL